MAQRTYYKPYGEVAQNYRSAQPTQYTSVGFTGQRLDAESGLMYYGARYYDPQLAYFISPDSIVPGGAVSTGGGGGTLGVEQNSKLTVDFHERGFSQGVAGENMQTVAKGYWFQLSDRERQQAREPWGPSNPQALDRYAYVLGNPLRYVDPSGHSYYLTHDEAVQFVKDLRAVASAIRNNREIPNNLAGSLGIISAIAAMVKAERASQGTFWGAALAFFISLSMVRLADSLDEFADLVERNIGEKGVAVTYQPSLVNNGTITVLNLDDGSYEVWGAHGELPLEIVSIMDPTMYRGQKGAVGTADANIWTGWHFIDDEVVYGPPGRPSSRYVRNARTGQER